MKVKNFFMLAAILLTSVCAMAQSNNTTPLKGDVNGDGAVDVADIVAVIDVMAKGEAGYFYFGTTQPTAANYTSLPSAISTYTSIAEANGASVNVTAGQTVYLLCPASWVEEKSVELEDNDGNSINFSEEKDFVTISGYVIYTAIALNTSKTISLKALSLTGNTTFYAQYPEPQVTYYWYAGQTPPTSISGTPTVDDTNFTNNKWHTLGSTGSTSTTINKTVTGGTPDTTWKVAVPSVKSFKFYDNTLTELDETWVKQSTGITVNGVSYDVWHSYATSAKTNVYMK